MAPGSQEGSKKDAPKEFEFPNFDVLSEDSAYSDHCYNRSNKSKQDQNYFNNGTSAVSKRIAKEWRILEQNLPESIYVRAYEDRMDLLRAVIIGTSGTPYHDGLFFFDIVIPPDYPKVPPKVRYHAHGLRLNPNLYASGYVCLSLIHTWRGSGVELWKPDNSTILQLLVSIQGLVLNDKPYFNEPGYGVGLRKMNEIWMKRSLAYNANAFILSCKTMLYKIRRPPKGFETFVVEHFQSRGDLILAAIKAYENGEAIVGQYREVESSSAPSAVSVKVSKISSKFKSDLAKAHSDLQSAFFKIDTNPPRMKNSIEIQRKKDEESANPKLKAEKSLSATKPKAEKSLSAKIVNAIKHIFK